MNEQFRISGSLNVLNLDKHISAVLLVNKGGNELRIWFVQYLNFPYGRRT